MNVITVNKMTQFSAKPEGCEVLKALYDFKATFSKTLSFSEGDLFILHKDNSKERNWWQVINAQGQLGFVPSNYVEPTKVKSDLLAQFLDDIINAINNGTVTADKEDIILKLTERKQQALSEVKPSSKKHPAPPPPSGGDCLPSPTNSSDPLDVRPFGPQYIDPAANNISTNGEVSGSRKQSYGQDSGADSVYSTNGKDLNSVQPRSQLNSVSSTKSCDDGVYEMVQRVRKETQLSHEMSRVAVETVLVSLKEMLADDPAIEKLDTLLRVITTKTVTCPTANISESPDALRLRTSLQALRNAANDAQQRGWALHDDEDEIQTNLMEVISIMSNADVKIPRHVLSTDHYVYVTTLVKYYQMETRWSIRQLLLQAFGVMCGLDRTALVTLAMSDLLAEVARDMKDNSSCIPRITHSALLTTMLLSMGDKLPVAHYEQLGVHFTTFLLEMIESPPDTDLDDQIPDLFLCVVLAYNLQFDNQPENLVLNALEARKVAKTFTEKILLLLNREDDPVRIFDHLPQPPHSVLKLTIDLFSRKSTADLFYTNDVKVLVDIIIRQLADLSAGDQRRLSYLRLCEGVLANAEQAAHEHRRPDLLKCFERIFAEEGAISRADQAMLRSITASYPQYFEC